MRALALACLGLLLALPAAAAEYAALPGGTFTSVLPADGKAAPAQVAPFRLRTELVTNAEFLAFVKAHPAWRRDKVARILADARYLTQWASADTLGDEVLPRQPVTRVSWFAAQAYCESERARLPSWYEWEFAAAADATRRDARADPAWRESILGWYSRPSTTALPQIGGAANIYGVRDINGLVWEWVDDFNALMVASDSRDQGDPDLLKFCGAGALSMQDKENYAVLMRIAMLSALKAADTTNNMGFRCAKSD
ncbi:formylglycine-generating enzyme family protein [Rhodanobacter sp. T12-5]|jgi:formylglycine-generating enzyme required for sulfatase activity|uniref:formylglycine-generating enzyme family protein n=1 Tax=Rhodanobacter sp. T12-5 TaxID=2024611 RepID=UPI0011EFDFDF|nr:formylglycine-generating enzyme family protein [Rhodanobacter sp. T12-5]KAA0071991.1 formylglycine-generating enzyme family protein [Rhodanobacter sp. T12-5]